MLEISRKDIPKGDLIDYPSEDRFIKLPIMPYMELLGITPIPSQVAIINAINNPKYRFICGAVSRRQGKTYISKSRINKNDQIDTIHENLKQNLLINYGFRSSRRLLLSIKSSPDFSLNELNSIATKVSSFLYNPENILIGVNNTFFKKNIIEATLIASDLKFSFANDQLPDEPKSFSYISNEHLNPQLVNNINNSNDNAIKMRILNLRKLIKIPIGFN